MTWIDVCSVAPAENCFCRGCVAQVLRNEVRTGDYRNSMDGG